MDRLINILCRILYMHDIVGMKVSSKQKPKLDSLIQDIRNILEEYAVTGRIED